MTTSKNIQRAAKSSVQKSKEKTKIDKRVLEKICANRVLTIIQTRGEIEYSQLLQKTRLPKEQLLIYLDALKRRGLVGERIVRSSGRPATVFFVKGEVE